MLASRKVGDLRAIVHRRAPALGLAFLVALALALSWAQPSLARGPQKVTELIEADADPCLTKPALVDGATRWLQRKELEIPLRVVVRVSPGAQVRFDVFRGDEHVGERLVDGQAMSCATLRNVVTFAIAVSVEGALRGEKDAQENTPPPDAASPAELARPRAPAPRLAPARPVIQPIAAEPREAQTNPWAVSVEELLFIDGSKVPPLGVAVDLERTIVSRLDARIGYFATTGTTVDVEPGVARTWLSAGRLHLCWAASEGRATLRGCVGGAAGTLLGRGYEFPAAGRARLFWAALSVRAELDLRLSSTWHLRLALSPTWVAHPATLLAEDERTGVSIGRAETPNGAIVVSSGLSYRF